jgi:integrase
MTVVIALSPWPAWESEGPQINPRLAQFDRSGCSGALAWANTLAWRQALKRPGIENFRWHDLRHTWASWLVQHGTPLYVVQEMGAWESEGMVRRYAHLAPAHLAEHAEVIAGILANTKPAQTTDEEGPLQS